MDRFIEALGLNKAAFYGWSDGRIIGLMLEFAHPGTVSPMAISGANQNPEGVAPDIFVVIAAAVEESHDTLSGMMQVEPNIDPDGLKKIEIPLLVTADSESVILPKHTRLIADSLPISQLEIVGEKITRHTFRAVRSWAICSLTSCRRTNTET